MRLLVPVQFLVPVQWSIPIGEPTEAGPPVGVGGCPPQPEVARASQGLVPVCFSFILTGLASTSASRRRHPGPDAFKDRGGGLDNEPATSERAGHELITGLETAGPLEGIGKHSPTLVLN